MSEENDRPDLVLEINRESGPYTIKMVYGLEMDLRRLLPDPATAMQLAMTDSFTQDYMIRRCLTPLNRMLKSDEELIPAEEVDMPTEETDRIIMWVLEHQLYFFDKRAKGIVALAARQKTVAPPLPSKSGSEDSALTTPSAGPLDASKATSTDSSGRTPVES